jgi:hypothetical protein
MGLLFAFREGTAAYLATHGLWIAMPSSFHWGASVFDGANKGAVQMPRGPYHDELCMLINQIGYGVDRGCTRSSRS